MKTLKTVIVEPVLVTTMPDKMEDGKLYISFEYQCAIHLCLCGCGLQTVTPIGTDGWNLVFQDNKVTMSPSISNYQYACKSHYIITNNKANFV